MKKLYLLVFVSLAFKFFVNAQPTHLVISQAYGAGGNSGAVYNRDFVELFNPTTTPVSLTGYSIQYASAAGTTWQKLDLNGTIAAGGYFLIQMTVAGINGTALPTPNQAAPTAIEMAAANGKLALVHSTTSITGTGCPAISTITDFVGYGTANCSETAAAPAASATIAIFRTAGGCIDTDNNASDFTSSTPSPRNSLTPANICPPGGPLPVRFTSFKVSQQSNGIRLQWTNDTEENLRTYVIERSQDARSFSVIGEVQPLKNDNSRVSYSSIDDKPLDGQNYYRIRAIENSGKEVYSSIARINITNEGTSLTVYPNPVRSTELNLMLSGLVKGFYHLKVYNRNGQLVKSELISHAGGTATETISLRNLPSGLYTILLAGKNRQLHQTFLIQ